MLDTLVSISWLIPLLPLLGAIVAGGLGKGLLKGQSHWPIWIGVGGAAVLSLLTLVALIGNQPDNAPHAATAGVGDTELVAAADTTNKERVAPQLAAALGESSTWYTWFAAGDPAEDGRAAAQPGDAAGYFEITAGAWIDPLSGVMLSVVCGIGFFITVFAAGYMKGEAGYWRFFAYLGLFIFFMSCLVMGENLIMLYLGWEGVGLCSYLLIGYYYDKPAAREASKKAFLVNRVGDFGFAVGIMLIFYCFGTVSYFGDGHGTFTGFVEMARDPLAHGVPADKLWLLELVPFCLMVGAFGKSAQFPLYVWLPDAMEGPTPVSALIHAATMVTSGVYMIARLSPLFTASEAALTTVAFVGAFTALFAATIALRQFDLKKVFAYSTVSQLGFMFVAVGVLAPVAGVFHLITHAFFKALLFLASGVVMHAMLGHLDMRKMSGLKHQLPKTRWLVLIGCAALAGVPLTSGFFSKDEIIHFAHVADAGWKGHLLWGVMLFTAFLTAYYTFRLYFRVFEGPEMVPTEPHPDHHHEDDGGHGHDDVASHDHADDHGHGHNHEPAVMMVPLYVLAVGAIIAGFINLPGVHTLGHFLGHSPSLIAGYEVAATDTFAATLQTAGDKHYAGEYAAAFGQPSSDHAKFPWVGFLTATVIALAGIGLAYVLHLKDRSRAERIAETLGGLDAVLRGRYWIDSIYQGLIVEPLRALGKLLYVIDDKLVSGLVYLTAFVPIVGGSITGVLQSGQLQGYATGMVLGVGLLALLLFVSVPGWVVIALVALAVIWLFGSAVANSSAKSS